MSLYNINHVKYRLTIKKWHVIKTAFHILKQLISRHPAFSKITIDSGDQSLSPVEVKLESEKRVQNLPQTVERALDILEAFLGSKDNLGVTELSHRVHLNKSTTYRIIQALTKRGYIRQDSQTNKYGLGYKILRIAYTSLNQNKLRERARQYLEELSKQTAHTVQLTVWEGNEVVYIDQVEGSDIFQLRLQIGNRGPLHCTAAGKCILAFLKESELDTVVRRCRLKRLTEKTITSIGQLRKELRLIRRAGFAFCNQEYDLHLRSIGAPILGMGSKVIGAVVLTAPSNRIRIKEVCSFGRMVRETGLKISFEMGGEIEKEVIEGP